MKDFFVSVFEFIKAKIIIIIVIMLPLLLIAGFIAGMSQTTEDNVLNELEQSLKNKDAEALSKILTVDNKSVDKDKLNPLIDLYNQDSSKIDLLISQLKNNQESDDFTIVKKNGIFGSKYFINSKVYTLKVSGNFDSCKFAITGQDNSINNNDTLYDLLPGMYNIKGSLKTDYGEVTKDENVALTSDKDVHMDLAASYTTIDSPFSEADVFINDTDSGIKAHDAKDIGPFPTDGSVKTHLEMESPWGKLTGDEKEVNQTPKIALNLNIENQQLDSIFEQNINEFYTNVFESLNTENKDAMTLVTDSTKDKIYSILEKKYFILKNKYTVKSIEINKEKSEYTFENNKYKATVVVQVDYTVSKKFFGLNEQDYTRLFFTRMVYSGDEWKIDDIDNFDL